jgi:uncharacterized protein (DUF433 family)
MKEGDYEMAENTMNIPVLVLDKYIETRIFGERPHIRGRRIPVATIAYNAHTHQWGVTRLTREFGLTEAEVLAALLYYEEHKEQIDAQEKDYQAELDEAFRLYGKKD